jgi:hypothetical protein
MGLDSQASGDSLSSVYVPTAIAVPANPVLNGAKEAHSCVEKRTAGSRQQSETYDAGKGARIQIRLISRLWCQCVQVPLFFLVLKVPVAFTVFALCIPLEIIFIMFNVFTLLLPVPIECRLYLHDCACWLTQKQCHLSKYFLGRPISVVEAMGSATDGSFDGRQHPLQSTLQEPLSLVLPYVALAITDDRVAVPAPAKTACLL